MSQPFDPYYLWLGIPPTEQPPHFYRLLGLRPLEGNPQVVDNAAQRVTAHLRGYLKDPAYQPAAQWLIGEVARASECLLDPAKKAIYDGLLAAKLSSPAVTAAAAPTPAAPVAAPLAPRVVAVAVQPAGPVTRPAGAPSAARPAKKQERIPQPVKIVLGGVAGLVMGYFIVLFITGNDVFGLWPEGNSPVAERAPAAVPSRVKQTATEPPPVTTPPRAAQKQGSPDLPLPTPNATPSPPTTAPIVQPSPPPIMPSPPGFAGPPLPAQPPPIAAPPPLNVAPLPGTTAAVPAPLPAKRPPPSSEEQQKSLTELQTLYKTEFEKGGKGDGRAPFVAFLLETARKLKSDPVAQFVLYREAYQRALASDDLFTVAEVIDELERTFDIDGYVFRMNLLTAAAKAAKGPEERLTCIHFVLHMADYAEATARI